MYAKKYVDLVNRTVEKEMERWRYQKEYELTIFHETGSFPTDCESDTDDELEHEANEMEIYEEDEFIAAKAFVLTYGPSKLMDFDHINPHDFDNFTQIYAREKGELFYLWDREEAYILRLESKDIPRMWREFVKVKKFILWFWEQKSIFHTLGDDIPECIYSYVYDEMWDRFKAYI